MAKVSRGIHCQHMQQSNSISLRMLSPPQSHRVAFVFCRTSCLCKTGAHRVWPRATAPWDDSPVMSPLVECSHQFGTALFAGCSLSVVVVSLISSRGRRQRIDALCVMKLRILCFTYTQGLQSVSGEYKIYSCN